MEAWKIRTIEINIRAIHSITQYEKRKCELKLTIEIKVQRLQAKSEVSKLAD
jgi:hypothetical protein